MNVRPLMLRGLGWLCVLAGVGLLCSGSAVAASIFSSVGEISGPSPGSSFGQLDSESVAVNDFNGHILVADSSVGLVYDFSSAADVAPTVWDGSGTPAKSFGGGRVSVAVDNSTGDVYVADTKDLTIDEFNSTGTWISSFDGSATPAGAFSHSDAQTPLGIAVDQATNDVYVVNGGHEVIDVFDASGVYLPEKQITAVPAGLYGFGGEYADGIAVNANTGNVFVSDSGAVQTFEFNALGGYVTTFEGLNTPAGSFGKAYTSVATENASGRVYINDTEHHVVDAFDAAGNFVGQITGTLTESFNGGVSVDQATGAVYVSDTKSVDIFSASEVPDVTVAAASGVTATSATLNGTVNPDGQGKVTCEFIWRASEGLEHTVPCPAEIAEGNTPVAVHVEITGLTPDITYRYHLQATSKNGTNAGTGFQSEFHTSGAGIHGQSASNVAATSATLTATIDPNSTPTTYYFQYGADASYGSAVPAAPGVAIGAGIGDLNVSQHPQDLSADTVYHYRVVAISELSPGHFEEFDGEDQTFTTQRSGGAPELPDGRSWELVTPPEKKGARFENLRVGSGIIQASSEGSAMADLASQPTEEGVQGSPPNGVSVFSTRGSSGWSSQVISPPHNEGTGEPVGGGPEYKFFSEDLSEGIMQPYGTFTPLSPQASEPTAYLRTDYLNGDVSTHCQSSCYTPLVTAANAPSGTVFGEEVNGECPTIQCGPVFLGATPDLSHIILRSAAQLTSTPTPTNEGGLYEWSGGVLRLVSVLPEGEGGAAALGPQFVGGINANHAVSDDGSRVIWSATSGKPFLTHLFLRDVARGETVRLDLPQGGSGTGSVTAPAPIYMGASSDGSRIFFDDAAHLTPEFSPSGEDLSEDLYEYNLNAPVGSRLTDLTVDVHAKEGKAESMGVVGASEDGSYVYFTAKGVLAAGAVYGSCEGDGPCRNLYVRHGGVTRWIAALSVEDPDAPMAYPDSSTVRVSPNGRWLAFMSDRNLTGYDTHDALSGRPDQEVYLYDADSGRLVCASCDPSGARPVGVEPGGGINLVGAEKHQMMAANVPAWTMDSRARYQSRYLSDSGRLFFNSNSALVSQDVNGTEDVYEYEPVGVPAGSRYECAVGSIGFGERSGGCVGLISSGTSPEESAFLDASVTGGDVFFLTASKLASQDFDTALDVYDAHECSPGSPCFAPAPVLPPACSTGDSCKAAPSLQPPVFGSPSSATFSGAGNVTTSLLPAVKSKSLTRAQRLRQALRACAKKHRRGQRRSVCERQARKQYGVGKQSRKANATKKSGR